MTKPLRYIPKTATKDEIKSWYIGLPTEDVIEAYQEAIEKENERLMELKNSNERVRKRTAKILREREIEYIVKVLGTPQGFYPWNYELKTSPQAGSQTGQGGK